MDFQQAIGLLAPLLVILVTQGLKRVISSRFAPLVVLLLGGTSALLGVGPTPGEGYVDSAINVAWISGLATFLYDFFKKTFGKASGSDTVKSIVIIFLVGFFFGGCASIGVKPFSEMTPKEKSLFFMSTYNREYENTMAVATKPDATPTQKEMVKKKKEVLDKVWPLIRLYDWTVSKGETPGSSLETDILNFIDQLMVEAGG